MTPVAERPGSADPAAERPLATPIERNRAHGAPIGHHRSVALAQEADDGQDQGEFIFLSLLRYAYYRADCARDARLKQLWGSAPE